MPVLNKLKICSRLARCVIVAYIEYITVYFRQSVYHHMSRIYVALLTILFICTASDAFAQTSRIYFAGYLGITGSDGLNFEDKTTPAAGTFEPDNTMNFAGAMGLRFTRNFRMEAELSYRDADFDRITIEGVGERNIAGEFKSTMLLLNGYYDFDIRNWRTQPFVTGGVGIGYHSGEITDNAFTESVADEAFGLVWNAGAGLKYRVRDDLAWTAGYRYMDGTTLQLENTDIDFSAHEIRIGLEWDFQPY